MVSSAVVIPCSFYANTNNVSSAPNCVCDSPFVWNSTSIRCNINCSLIENAVASTANTYCICRSGFTWNGNTLICQNSTTVNCTQIINTNGSAAVNGACFCKSSYAWDPYCFGCDLSCTSVSSTVPHTVATNGVCVCASGFVFNISSATCISIVQVNCISLPNTSGANTSVGCNRNAKYYWDSLTLICVLDCKGIANTAGTPPVNGTCTCASGYLWNAPSTSC